MGHDETPRGDQPDALSAADQHAIDALVDAGFDIGPAAEAAPEHRARKQKIAALLELLEDYPVEDGDDTLVHATLARIDRHEDQRAARMSVESAAAELRRGRRRIWMPDFISVAAVLLIGAGVLWPVLANMQRRAADMSCSNNLRQIGYAFGNYAADHNAAVPTAFAAGLTAPIDKAANIFSLDLLVDGGYCSEGHRGCPAAHDAGGHVASYSVAMSPGPDDLGKARGSMVLLGDRNPLIDAFNAGGSMPALSLSPNHGGRGQNVLASDGTTMWLTTPVVGRDDNIWLPTGMDALELGARPGRGDVFLVH